MAGKKNLTVRTPRAFQFLRQAARAAEEWPVAGSAVRRFQDAETWAMAELKQRLDAMSDAPQERARTRGPAVEGPAPRDMMARLITQSRGVDPEAARVWMYRQTLSRLVPDQVAMMALLADREIAPLCNVAAGRLPAGPVSVVVLANASSLGRDAGVLLRDYVPQYMSEMLALGVFEAGPEDDRLADQYELLLADTQLRKTMDRVRREMKLYPRLQRFSVHMSDYGKALWQDCRPAEVVSSAPTQGA
ncbi:hypothetical protein SSPSH_001910 [Salinisphaera shabanensis E1L3A]|uniref:DUF4393 domain-containing protein n=1 Tax=Salinisphaera shabanensis E1L3A TaxID=1033802 RepID=F7Q543_9GAMM|nr:hypothetical protein [Salinisphaera shabanensis]ERJ19071.1 hypothetical protein SSPSH_001910 [Salinisphaera shabanensis E1L3A]